MLRMLAAHKLCRVRVRVDGTLHSQVMTSGFLGSCRASERFLQFCVLLLLLLLYIVLRRSGR